MRSIAIITLFGNYNIGNKLQNFAVEQIYQKVGLNVNTIWYDLDECEATGHKNNKFKTAIKEFLSRIGIKTHAVKMYELEQKRYQKFCEFSKRYLHLGQKIIDFHMPNSLKDNYDFFSVGSDQVWRNWSNTYEEIKYFLLSDVKSEKRICLAPSLGRESIGDEKIFKEELSKFKYLSCREYTGSQLIAKVSNRYVETLVDPTMAVDISIWEGIAQKPDFLLPDKFILAYFLGDRGNDNQVKLEEIAMRLNLPIVDIYNKAEYPDYYICDPLEFLYLIKNAVLVCTNSFHGTVFSILFNTNFIYFERKDTRADMTGRVKTLLKVFGLENRTSKIAMDDILGTDFTFSNSRLIQEKAKVFNYIEKAIGE